MKFSYSATKVNGKFAGGIYAQNSEGAWEQIALFEDIKRPRSVKAIAKAEALRYKELQKEPENHIESHSINGTGEL